MQLRLGMRTSDPSPHPVKVEDFPRLSGCCLQTWLQHGIRSEERRVGKECRSTRWTGDWSSDVCSSDLASGASTSLIQRQYRSKPFINSLEPRIGFINAAAAGYEDFRSLASSGESRRFPSSLGMLPPNMVATWDKIGRASCRERV